MRIGLSALPYAALRYLPGLSVRLSVCLSQCPLSMALSLDLL